MAFLKKHQGSILHLSRENLAFNFQGSVSSPEQGFVKSSGVWYPIFPELSQAHWGYAQYAGPELSSNGYLGAQSFIEEHLTNRLPLKDGETLTYDLPDGQTFAYFAHPASMGVALFTDLTSSFQGSWDGAKWLDDFSNFDETGPIEVTFDDGTGPVLWYVYRTDWAGPSSAPSPFQIDYPNQV